VNNGGPAQHDLHESQLLGGEHLQPVGQRNARRPQKPEVKPQRFTRIIEHSPTVLVPNNIGTFSSGYCHATVT
jgi:hypothetical protein